MLHHEILEHLETIGDIEQTLAGEEQEIDTLLSRQNSAPSLSIEQPIISQAHSPLMGAYFPSQSNQFKDQYQLIETWMSHWIQKNLKVPAAAINSTKEFAGYGMDSVTAVEFAQDLETWLNYTIEPTVVWNYTTPQALAQYLATQTSGENQHLSSQAVAKHKSAVISPNLAIKNEAMAENDLAELLAREIEYSKQF
jgi:acyl carrier protein